MKCTHIYIYIYFSSREYCNVSDCKISLIFLKDLLLWNSTFNKIVYILTLVKSTVAVKFDSGLGEEISVFLKALVPTPASYSMGIRHFFLRSKEGTA
jgi:hypothetical protein